MDLGQGGQSAIWGAKTFAEAKTNITQFRKEFISALSKLGEEGNTIWKRINEDYEGDVDAFIAAINAGIEKLSPAAEKLYTALTPDELNAKAEKARQEAENAAKKAASDQERNLKELTKQLQKLRDDALQAEVDSMKEGTAKKLAQIDLDYQKRARAIQEAEERIRELQGGELTKGQQAQIKALNQVNEKNVAKIGMPRSYPKLALKTQRNISTSNCKHGTSTT